MCFNRLYRHVDSQKSCGFGRIFYWRYFRMDNRTKTSQMISDPPVERNADGTFQKGVSGNPGGRPKRTPAEQQAIDRMKEITPEAVEVVYGILFSVLQAHRRRLPQYYRQYMSAYHSPRREIQRFGLHLQSSVLP